MESNAGQSMALGEGTNRSAGDGTARRAMESNAGRSIALGEGTNRSAGDGTERRAIDRAR
jgi:hypothetical protein